MPFQRKSWNSFTDVRPSPSVLYLFRKYFGDTLAKYALYKNIPVSLVPYKFKSNRVLKLVGLGLMIFASPYIFFKVRQSWKLAGKKLAEGPLLEPIN